MNLTELILNKNQIAPFIITVLLTYVLYKFLNKHYDITSNNMIPLPLLISMIYVIFLIVYRIINTNTNFSKPLVNYIIHKKNFKEEPYQINYINPFITNLDKVDFNMKKSTNKKYIKRILNELLIRKYVKFENVLAYNKDPWEIIKLTEDNLNYKTENEPPMNIYDNKYCRNYLDKIFNSGTDSDEKKENAEKQCLILYRKHILQFEEKLYFIFEKKNKEHSKYYLNECISQIVVNSNTDYYSIIDTRDLHYDRQYVVFVGFPENNREDNKWEKPVPNFNDGYDTRDTTNNFPKTYKKFVESPSQYFWQNDWEETVSDDPTTIWKNVYVIDIYFIYNDMVILDENRNISNKLGEGGESDNTADFSLNKYYNKKDWILKRYYNFVRNQFNNRMDETNLFVKMGGIFNNISTVKFRKILGKNVFGNSNLKMNVSINEKTDTTYENKITLYPDATNDTEKITINFEDYIKKHIQKEDVEPGELVIIKDKNTQYDKNNSLVVDKSTINYI